MPDKTEIEPMKTSHKAAYVGGFLALVFATHTWLTTKHADLPPAEPIKITPEMREQTQLQQEELRERFKVFKECVAKEQSLAPCV